MLIAVSAVVATLLVLTGARVAHRVHEEHCAGLMAPMRREGE